MGIDLYFINFINGFRSDFWNSIFTNVVIEKSLYVWIALIVILLCIKKTRKLGLVVAISFVLTLILSEGIIKYLVGRERPFINHAIDIIGKRPTSFSFPSASAALSFSVFGAFLFSKNKYSILIGIFALVVAFSRVYVGAHYFTDILGGMVLGIICGYIANRIVIYFDRRNHRKKYERIYRR